MSNDMILNDEIVRLRQEKGWEQIDLARRAAVKQQTLSLIEKGITKTSRQIGQIAKALDVPVEQIDTSFQGITMAHSPRAGVLGPLGNERPFPFYAAAEGGDDGSIILDWNAIEFTATPYGLDGIKDAYGMYVIGDSMEPRFDQGDRVLINPHLPARPGNDVLLFQSRNGETKALIKRLVRAAPAEWIVKQFNPAKTFRLARPLWQAHVIVGHLLHRL